MSRFENAGCRRKDASYRRGGHDTAFPPDSVDPLAEGRTFQTMDGAGRQRPFGPDAGPRNVHRAGNGRLQTAGIFRELDKPTPEKHGGPQGTHRRMAAPGRRGPAIRNSDGHYHPSVGGPHDKSLQAVQRVEKGKPARQHDQYRIGVEYAGRSVRYGDFQTTPPQRIPAEC